MASGPFPATCLPSHPHSFPLCPGYSPPFNSRRAPRPQPCLHRALTVGTIPCHVRGLGMVFSSQLVLDETAVKWIPSCGVSTSSLGTAHACVSTHDLHQRMKYAAVCVPKFQILCTQNLYSAAGAHAPYHCESPHRLERYQAQERG
jgi:hypothetical protein